MVARETKGKLNIFIRSGDIRDRSLK